jgi:hypothetical protein
MDRRSPETGAARMKPRKPTTLRIINSNAADRPSAAAEPFKFNLEAQWKFTLALAQLFVTTAQAGAILNRLSQDCSRVNLAATKAALLGCVEHLDAMDQQVSRGGVITNAAAAAAMQASLAKQAAPTPPESPHAA